MIDTQTGESFTGHHGRTMQYGFSSDGRQLTGRGGSRPRVSVLASPSADTVSAGPAGGLFVLTVTDGGAAAQIAADSAALYSGRIGAARSGGALPALSGIEALGQRREELDVAIRLGEPVEQQLDAFVGADSGEHPAH